MTIALFAQVAMRDAFNVALSWSQKKNSMAIFTWVVMIGGSLGVREGFHVRISLLPWDALPGAVRSALERLFDLGTFAFGISLLLVGQMYVRFTVGQVSAGSRLSSRDAPRSRAGMRGAGSPARPRSLSFAPAKARG